MGIIATIVQILCNYRYKINWYVLLFFVVLLGGGVVYAHSNIVLSNYGEPDVRVRIVQPVTTQARKISLSRADALNQAKNRVQELIKLADDVRDVDLVVYPETSYPFVLRKYGDEMPIAVGLHKPVIVGATVFEDGKVFNSLVLANEKGEIEEVYDKSHLVPFGEYGPIKFIPAPANLTAGDGARVMPVRMKSGKKLLIAPAVCYEILFSGAVVNRDSVDAIINITNDTWFGKTSGTYQHMDMVRRAAIESGVPVIRANYSGISGFVGADGTVVAQIPIGQVGVLDGSVYGAHMTLYRLLGRDAWFLIIMLVAFIGGFVAYRADKK